MSNLPLNLFDGDLYQWDIQTDGSIAEGTDNAFDGGLELEGFAGYGDSDDHLEDGGREVVIGPRLVGLGYGAEVTITRKIYVPSDQGYARFLEIITNTKSYAIDNYFRIRSNLGSDTNTEIVATSSGDNQFTNIDKWIITDDTYNPSGTGTGANNPTVLQVVAGATAYRPDYVYTQTGDDDSYFNYRLKLAPGETKIILHFAAQNSNLAAATTKASQLEQLGLNALAGMSNEEKSQVINFATGFNDAILPPDLTVTTASTTTNLLSWGETIPVSWTVKNLSQAPASEYWYDNFYLSNDALFDQTDRYLTYEYHNDLAAGDSYSTSKNITLPTNPSIDPGEKYLLVVTDGYNYRLERNENNNVFAIPIKIKGPDLIVSEALVSPTIVVKDKTSISWTVTNQGNGSPLYNYWYDSVYLSDDTTLDPSDTYISVSRDINNQLSLKVGESYTETGYFTTPTSKIGNRYLLFVTDQGNYVRETNENNNILAIQVKVQAPDLAVTNIVAPVETFSGIDIEVVWTVANQGNLTTTESWYDAIYLRDTTTSQDLLIGQFASSGALAAGASIERSQLITLPIDLKGNFKVVVKTGDYLLYLGKDPISTNNTLIDDSSLNVILSPFPNLQVESVSAPNTGFSGQQTTIEWKVTNRGTGATNATYWYDSVWLSTDETLDNSDIYLGSALNASYLNVGESYTNSLSVVLPDSVDGEYRFLVKTDSYHSVYEYTNENDNVNASNISRLELTPPPDLQPITIAPPTVAFSGQKTTLNWTVTNNGPGTITNRSWIDQVYLSSDTVLDPNDYFLGNRPQFASLELGQSYNTSLEVSLPIGISGNYYFFVRTDASNQINEFAYEANNINYNTTPTNVRLTPPPDLEIDSINISANASASHALNISYRVINSGATATPNYAWNDAIYLSTDNQLDWGNDLLLGEFIHYGVLDTGKFYDNSLSLIIPDGLSGAYYAFVVSDSNNTVFELDNDNNIGLKAGTVNIASRPADLIVSSINLTNNLEAGKASQLTWTVVNQGTGDTAVSNWTDKIFVSTDATLDSQDLLLNTFYHTGLLDKNTSYTSTETFYIPFSLEGQYYLFVETDTEKKVYEANNDNNNSKAQQITVSRQTPDLQVVQTTASTTALSGENLTVSWKVKNLGTGRTNSNYWYDSVYLSSDAVLNTQIDTYLGQVFHNGVLDVQGVYSASGDFKLPVDLTGNFYVFVRSDDQDRSYYGNNREYVIEGSLENNNDKAASNLITISLGTVPDLALTSVNAPSQGIAGQLFNLTWTVRNEGSETSLESWYDVIYLSRDQVFDRNSDTYLGYWYHTGGLAAGQSYTETQSFKIPQGLSGPFYVFIVADAGDRIYERSLEANNVGYDLYSIQVDLPTPADLVVGEITIPINAVPGQDATITYTVTNQGPNVARGSWYDSIYLSADEQWDLGDALFGRVLHTGDVDNGGNYNETLTTTVPGVVPGNYHVIVRSDIRNAIAEDNDENNFGASLDKVVINVEALSLNGSASGTLQQGQSVYYRIDVPEGETIQIHFDSVSDDAFNELYIRYGAIASQSEFDYGFEEVAADQKVIVPLTKPGTYYILARGQYVPNLEQNYTLTANTIDFGVSSIGQTIGDKGGKITLEIEGAKFTPEMVVILEDEVGHSITASEVWFEDSTKIFATFDLTTAPIGTYDLKVTQSVYKIEYQNNGNGTQPFVTEQVNIDTYEDSFTVIDARQDNILISVISTPAIRGGDFDIVVSYTNRGTHDVIAPLIIVNTDPDVLLRNIQDADGLPQRGSMTLLGISNEGVAGILRPGETGLIRLRGTAPSGFLGEINITARQMVDDGTPINYEDFVEYLDGDISTQEWAIAAKALENEFGLSWSSFREGLAKKVTELGVINNYTHSVLKIWSDVLLDAWGKAVFPDSSEPANNNVNSLNAATSNTTFVVASSLSSNSNLSLTEGKALLAANQVNLTQEDLLDLELVIKLAAEDMRRDFQAFNAANALYDGNPSDSFPDFIGIDGLEGPPFGTVIPEEQESVHRFLLKNAVGDDEIVNLVLSSHDEKVTQFREDVSDGMPPYPYESLYASDYFDESSTVSREVKNSLEYNDYFGSLNSNVQNFFKDYTLNLLKQNAIEPNGNPVQPSYEYNYIDARLINSSFKGFNFFSFTKNLPNYYRYFYGSEGAADLALLIGRTGPADQRVKINNISVQKDEVAGCQILNYTVNYDFYIWDSTTFDTDNGQLYNPASALANNFPGGASLALLSSWVRILSALGAARPLQQYGYATPRFHVIKVNQTLSGTIFETYFDDFSDLCPPDEPPPTPPSNDPPGEPGNPGNPGNPGDPGSPGNSPNNSFDPRNTTTRVIGSADPNDIIGPRGFGAENWICAIEPLNYTIRFENDPNLATAPAQIVRISQQLDSDLDFRTFRVGDFSFGDTFVDVPDNRAFYQTRLDLTANEGIYVDVVAGIDLAKGEAFWEFTSIDPATGATSVNPLQGFLPPNLTSPEGQGFVNYSIKPKSNIVTGTVIDAVARIIFDTNEPIDTPPIFNTIDPESPTSTVNPLPATTDNTSFLVSWSGSDSVAGSALADYTIYVSDNGGVFTPWLENTILTEASYIGVAGHTYRFYSVSRDHAGNIQTIPNTAQASITLADPNGNNFPIVIVNENLTLDEAATANITTRLLRVTDSQSSAAEVTYTLTDLPDYGTLLLNSVTLTLNTTFTQDDIDQNRLTYTHDGSENFSDSFSFSASDQQGHTTDNTLFNISVTPVNDSPVLNEAIADQSATEAKAFSFTIAANTFSDPDLGDSLTYTATLDNSSPLPSWLNFNATTRTFSGTPNTVNIGNFNITVIASDRAGASISDIFILSVKYANKNLVGDSANNLLIGGAGDDTLDGKAGNDTLNGGLGNDTIIGGPGNDTYLVDSNEDLVTENLNEGIDIVNTSISYTLGDNVEKLTLTATNSIEGRGNSFNNTLIGNTGNNILVGLAGNDTLDGKTGNDTMVGGLGNDIYTVDSNEDRVSESANEGTDSINTSVTYTLEDNVEKLILTGTNSINGTGNNLSNTLTGNSGNNILVGLEGNDTLDGKAGNDTMLGGLGNDIYTLDSNTDIVSENVNEGTDLVNTSVNYTLRDNLENLTLTGSSNLDGTGNSLNNTLTGNSGANRLSGEFGNDSLNGGNANDTLYGGEGNDTISAGTGNDILEGSQGNDRLQGGAGSDLLTGGEGVNTFVINPLSDSLLFNFDRISDLDTGVDKIDGPIAVSAALVIELGQVSALTESVIASLLNSVNFNANRAATFTLVKEEATRTFVALNNKTIGFSASDDAIIEITGYTGQLTNLAII